MLLRLAYLAVPNTFSFKEIEILVLRHQLAVLQRQESKPAFTPEDQFLLSGLLHPMPRGRLRHLTFLIRPDTILRWHRDLLQCR